MGKYYSFERGNLYIFTTESDKLIDLHAFPGDLNLFEAESAWRLSPRVAVAEEVLQESSEEAKVALSLHGYEEVKVGFRRLESYFLDAEEDTLIEGLVLKLKMPVQAVELEEV